MKTTLWKLSLLVLLVLAGVANAQPSPELKVTVIPPSNRHKVVVEAPITIDPAKTYKAGWTVVGMNKGRFVPVQAATQTPAKIEFEAASGSYWINWYYFPDEGGFVQRASVVDVGSSPQPEPEPDDPVDPDPTPAPKTEQVLVVIVEDTSARTPELGRELSNDFWPGLAGRGHAYVQTYNGDPVLSGKNWAPLIKDVQLPAALLLNRKTGEKLEAFTFKTTAELDKRLKEISGK